LSQIVIHSPELMFVCDRDLVCRFVSDSVQGITGTTPDTMVGFDLKLVIHRDDLPRVHEALDEVSAHEGIGAGYCELDIRVRFTDGRWHDMCIRARQLTAADSAWILITARDVTADRRNAGALLRKIELESLLEKVQHRFLSARGPETDEAVSWALEELGRFLGADRAYLLTQDPDRRTTSMTDEWCASGVEPVRRRFQDVPFHLLPRSMDRALRGETSAIPDVSALHGEWDTDRRYLDAAELRSLLLLPMATGSDGTGSLGLAWTTRSATWTSDDLVVLGMFAATFAQLLERRRSDAVLTATMDELRTAFDRSPVALALLDTAGNVLRANEETCRMLARDEHELIGLHSLDLVAPESHDACRTWVDHWVDGRADTAGVLEVRMATGDGRELWVAAEPRRGIEAAGEVESYVVRLSDVTETRRTRNALTESEHRFAALVDNLPDPVMRVTAEGRTLFTNAAARRLIRSLERGMIEPGVLARIHEARNAAVRTGTIQTAAYELATLGGMRFLETRFVPESAGGEPSASVLMVSTDLTDRRRSEAELAHRASHDGLTELPKRLLFLSHLHVGLDRVERAGEGLVAVVFFDLDRFKVVNDSLGHAAGDQLLVAAARRLRTTLRPEDVVARLGGDEFCVLLTTCSTVEQVMATAKRLQASLGKPVEVAGRELVVTASLGVAVTHTAKESAEELMAWADAAMYRAKEAGRDRIHLFDDALAADVKGRLELDQQLRRAFEHGELEVWYQPEIELSSGRTVGVEALLRWRTPHGVTSAAEFIGMAEENGLIVPIGWKVLQDACDAAARWNATPEGHGLTLRVNLSARQLDQPDLIDRVSEALDRSGLPASQLCLEITETALMANAAESRELLLQLDDLGVGLAVDDFGTGYSSLSYLKQFPVDVLKIDRSFVDGLPDDGEDAAIVATIIRLAESLGMQVTAEGIEHEAQARRLREMGCDRGQGWLYSQAVPEEQLMGFVAGSGDVT
jgi:diguanylate cyclase (GGDEF)-like protein/PAS domain S-box-containing protein